MNYIKSLSFVCVAAALGLMSSSCTGSFDEINTDPDALTAVPSTNILADVLRATAGETGGMDATSEWAGYIVAIQYLSNYQYLPTNNTYGNKWRDCYRGVVQLEDILNTTNGNADQLKNIRWVARIWQNFLFLQNTDQFGDMPYSEALQGGKQVLKPQYDQQSVIYPDILKKLKSIADEMAGGLGTDAVGDGDFLFNGDMKLWQKFCNSLRLRAAMRIVNVSPELAKSTVEEICQSPDKYPVLSSTDENAYFYWQGSGSYFEPWMDNARTRDDYGMSDILIDYLKEMQDPRLSVIAKPAATDGEYRGFENGALAQPKELGSISRIGALYRDNAQGFTPILKACENYFIMAEAAQKGWKVGMTAEEAYKKAVKMSMTDNGVTEVAAETYLNGKGKWDGTLARIYNEEWVALFKEGYEAWSLHRRTGYPLLIQSSGHYPGKRNVYGTAHNDVPFRMPLPDEEFLYNADNANAATKDVKDYTWGKKMWWDIRTNVK